MEELAVSEILNDRKTKTYYNTIMQNFRKDNTYLLMCKVV